MVAQAAWGIPESPEAAQAQREADEAYETHLIDWDEEVGIAREAIGYWDFTESNGVSIDQVDERFIDFEAGTKVEEGTRTPLIESFVQWWFLSPEEGQLVARALIENDSEEAIANIGLPEEKEAELISVLAYVDDPDVQDIFIENFENDFWEILWLENMDQSQQDIFRSLGANYILPSDGNISAALKNKALDVAFETSLNMIINNRIFERSETFDVLSDTIRDEEANIRDRFEALDQVNTMIHNDQGKKGWRRKLDTLTAQKNQLLRQAGLEERFNEAQRQLQIAEKSQDTKAILVARAHVEELTEKATLWDIAANWDRELEIWWVEWGKNEDDDETA